MTATMGDVTFMMAGHELRMMPERAVFWPTRRWLFVADTHWGKCQAFRDAGSALPMGPLLADLERLRAAAVRVGANRVVVLGDLVHGPSSFAPGMDELIQQWRPSLPCDLALVPGNHDRMLISARAHRLLERWRVEVLETCVGVDGLTLTHEPPVIASGDTLCGHVHPAVRMRGRGESMKLPCFWHDAAYRTLVLPAFSSLVDGASVKANPGDERWATAGSRVLRV